MAATGKPNGPRTTRRFFERGDQEPFVEDKQDRCYRKKNVRQHPDGGLEVRQRSRVRGHQLPGRHIVAALRNAHGDTFRRDFRPGQADIARNDSVAGLMSLPQKHQLAAGGIGDNGFKDKALVALHKPKPRGVCQPGASVWIARQFPRQYIGFDEPQARGLEVGTIIRWFCRPRSVRRRMPTTRRTLPETRLWVNFFQRPQGAGHRDNDCVLSVVGSPVGYSDPNPNDVRNRICLGRPGSATSTEEAPPPQ